MLDLDGIIAESVPTYTLDYFLPDRNMFPIHKNVQDRFHAVRFEARPRWQDGLGVGVELLGGSAHPGAGGD